MSGLLVKSTVVMRDNLAELNSRGLAGRWPVLLGGAALTRAYVEQDLAALFDGEVRYARDAFEGLRLMDAAMAVKRGEPGAALPALRSPRGSGRRRAPRTARPSPDRRCHGPFGRRHRHPGARRRRSSATEVIKGIPLAEYAAYLDERATVHGPVGAQADARRRAARPTRSSSRPRAGRGCGCGWSGRRPRGCSQAAVVYGYFRCVSDGNDLIVLDEDGSASWSGSPSPGSGATGACAWPTSSGPADSGETDVVAFQLVTMGPADQPRPPPSCSPRTPTASTWSCTGCPSSSPRPSPSTGTPGSGRSSASPAHDPADLDGIFRVDYRGAPVLVRLPGLPGPGRPGQGHAPARPERIGVELSEEMQLHPEQSTDAIVVHHPEAKYFSV